MKHDFFQVNEAGAVILNGGVAEKLSASGFNVNSLRPYIGEDGKPYMTTFVHNQETGKMDPVMVPITTNAVLRKDEWIEMDQILLDVARERLVGVQDLESRGLAKNLTNGFGTTVFQSENVSDMNAAEFSMDGARRTQGDRVEFDTVSLPLPIAHKDFTINARVLETSRRVGESLDMTQLRTSARKVTDLIETTLFQGYGTYTFGGGSIYGYQNFPDRNTGSLTASWTASAATGETILADVVAMKQASISAKHYGPWILYIPTAYETVLDGEFKAASDRSIRERLLAISGIEDIKVSDYMTAANVLLVEMKVETVRMVNGMELTNVQWDTQGGMVHDYKVMAIKIPQIRADQDGNCGIVHYS